jgi:hypothetical protein
VILTVIRAAPTRDELAAAFATTTTIAGSSVRRASVRRATSAASAPSSFMICMIWPIHYPHRTFSERLPEVVASSAHRPMRLVTEQRHLGLQVGGVIAARIAQRQGIPVGLPTLLRLVLRTPPTERDALPPDDLLIGQISDELEAEGQCEARGCKCRFASKGNVIAYGYHAEDNRNVDLNEANECNRTRTANHYHKRVKFGNYAPYFPKLAADSAWPAPLDDTWFFEIVFDYGDHDQLSPHPKTSAAWPVRNDPFSSYRSGFEVRTYGLCQRVLMFHHFPDEPEVGAACLVRSTDFTYSYEQDPAAAQNPIFSYLCSATQTSYQRQGASGYRVKSLPPVDFTYSEATIQPELRELAGESQENLPIGIDGAGYQWIDLDGEGLSGILSEQAGAWLYKRNLSPVNLVGQDGDAHVEACFGAVELVASQPVLALANRAQFLDLAGDGRPDLVQFDGATPAHIARCLYNSPTRSPKLC